MTKVSIFENNIIKYNTWFKVTSDNIIKEEGDEYKKYVRSIFCANLSCDDQNFVDTIKDEQRKWIQGKRGTSYSYHELLGLGKISYNKLFDAHSWRAINAPKTKEAEKYIRLATQLMSKMNSIKQGSGKFSAIKSMVSVRI